MLAPCLTLSDLKITGCKSIWAAHIPLFPFR
jgi:hypothetical protein